MIYRILFIVSVLAIPVLLHAVEQEDRKVIISSPDGNESKKPITLSIDSKLVRDYLRKNKNQQRQNKPAKQNNRNLQKSKNKQLNRTTTVRQTNEPIIVELEGVEDQPPVVNKTKQFVFKDITQRGASQPSDVADRTRNIELLRQQGAKR